MQARAISEESINDHFNLIHFILKKYYHIMQANNVEYDDLFQVGSMGLLVAIRKFNPTRGFRFSTYAVFLIKAKLNLYLTRENGGLFKFPRPPRELYFTLIRKGLLDSSPEEIDQELKCGLKLAQRALAISNISTISANRLIDVGNERSQTFGDLIPFEEDYSAINVAEFLSTLSEREETVVRLRSQGLGQADIGFQLGVTQVSVSRILKRVGLKYQQHMEGR